MGPSSYGTGSGRATHAGLTSSTQQAAMLGTPGYGGVAPFGARPLARYSGSKLGPIDWGDWGMAYRGMSMGPLSWGSLGAGDGSSCSSCRSDKNRGYKLIFRVATIGLAGYGLLKALGR